MVSPKLTTYCHYTVNEDQFISSNNRSLSNLPLFSLVALLLFVRPVANGQDTCGVLLDRISGEYEGECKKGLAHGDGKAIGADTYEGEFKKGYPDGKGKYRERNGVIYEGGWERGMKNGAGKLLFPLLKGDSIVEGYWRDNRYLGQTNLPVYSVNYKLNIARYSLKSAETAGPDRLTLFITEYGGSASNFSDLQITSSSGVRQDLGNRIYINNIDFPFTTRITYTTLLKFSGLPINVVFDITINDPGSWNLNLTN